MINTIRHINKFKLIFQYLKRSGTRREADLLQPGACCIYCIVLPAPGTYPRANFYRSIYEYSRSRMCQYSIIYVMSTRHSAWMAGGGAVIDHPSGAARLISQYEYRYYCWAAIFHSAHTVVATVISSKWRSK